MLLLSHQLRLASRPTSRLAFPTVRGLASAAATGLTLPKRSTLSIALSIAGAATFLSASAAAESKAAPANKVTEADQLFDSNNYAKAASLLRAELAARPTDADLLWRLARVLKKLADEEKPKTPAKESAVREGLGLAERALAADDSCGPAHKWYAILLSEVGSFGGTSDTIKNSFVVREHFERAVALSPQDATSRHLLGLWCFEVAKLSWIEQKVASAIFAAPPKATFAEAVEHFEAAEAMSPGFYPKNLLMLAQAHAKLGQKTKAKQWLGKCLAAKPATPEDEETLKQAAALKL